MLYNITHTNTRHLYSVTCIILTQCIQEPFSQACSNLHTNNFIRSRKPGTCQARTGSDITTLAISQSWVCHASQRSHAVNQKINARTLLGFPSGVTQRLSTSLRWSGSHFLLRLFLRLCILHRCSVGNVPQNREEWKPKKEKERSRDADYDWWSKWDFIFHLVIHFPVKLTLTIINQFKTLIQPVICMYIHTYIVPLYFK